MDIDRLCVHLKVYLVHIKTRSCTEITDGGQSWPPHHSVRLFRMLHLL